MSSFVLNQIRDLLRQGLSPNVSGSLWAPEILETPQADGIVDQNALPGASTGAIWDTLSTTALPAATTDGVLLTYKNALWYIGGRNGSGTAVRTVYRSVDGTTWTEVGTNSLPVANYQAAGIVFLGKMWYFGGYTTAATAAVYSSTDGVTWTAEASLPVACYQNAVAVLNGYLYLAAGYTTTYSATVYRTSDGKSWSTISALPASVVGGRMRSFGGYLFYIGGKASGGYSQAVYRSDGGVTWEELGTNVLPAACWFPGVCVYNNRLWLIGGGNATVCFQTVHSSPDGQTWTEAGSNALPSAARNQAVAVFRGCMIIVGRNTAAADSSGAGRQVYQSRPAVSGNLNITGDVAAAGGFRNTIDGWNYTDMAANLTGVTVSRTPSACEPHVFRPLRAGSVMGIMGVLSAAPAAGSVRVSLFKNGDSVDATLAAAVAAGATLTATTIAKDALTFAAGDALEVRLTTSADLDPATLDLRASLEIED